ncbi:hypothetical protein GCM10009527_095820 [Actinomadura nitritigenes]
MSTTVGRSARSVYFMGCMESLRVVGFVLAADRLGEAPAGVTGAVVLVEEESVCVERDVGEGCVVAGEVDGVLSRTWRRLLIRL